MTDLMNEIEYKKACRYRIRETLENVSKMWESKDDKDPSNILDEETLDKSLGMLQNAVEELKYFREKIQTTGGEFEGLDNKR